jgi:hypothetical protein
MESNKFSINKKTREQLSKGAIAYHFWFGIIVLIIGVLIVVRKGFPVQSDLPLFAELLIVMGIINIVQGKAGKEPFRKRYFLSMDSVSVRIKKSYERELVISLDSISYLKILPLKLELTMKDFVKTYDFSFLTQAEFDNLKTRIIDYCVENKIEIEK